MKILFKAIGLTILNFILLLFLVFLFNNIGNLIIGNFKRIDIKDWWYGFVEYKTFNYVLATVLLSDCIFMIWQLTIKHTKSLISAFFLIIIGEVALVITNNFYWCYIQETCFVIERTNLGSAYIVAFGSYEIAQRFFLVYICTFFAVGVILNRFEFFFRNPINNVVAHQIFSNDEMFLGLLCNWLPIWIKLTGSYYVVGTLEIPISRIATVVLGMIVPIHIITKMMDFRWVKNYYASVIYKPNENDCLVIVKESRLIEKSFIYHSLLRDKKYMKSLDDEKIRLLPKVLATPKETTCIVLDIYDNSIFIKNSVKEQAIIDELTQERGTFNIAYCLYDDTMQELKPIYDQSVSNMDEAIKEIIRLKGFLEYRKKQVDIIAKLQIEKLSKTNCIIDEIIIFKQYFDQNINEFLVFDYSIKWLEIINYIYTLIIISKQEVIVTNRRIGPFIEMADFKKWSELRKETITDETVDAIMNKPHIYTTVFQNFNSLWKTVTSREYDFSNYSINELLEAANILRNYTRGHGVFTFEISQEINLALIETLVFLINQLINNHLLDEDFSNLEKLGWILYVGDVPYFLYSFKDISDKYQEYCFNSFRNGNSIMLPADIWG